jgi:hypothetical protein
MERVRFAVDQFRAGNPDAILESLADDVVLITPIYPVGKPIGEPIVRGKAAIRAHLLERLKYNEGLSVVGTFPNERGHVAMLRSASGGEISVSIELNESGLGQKVMIFHM